MAVLQLRDLVIRRDGVLILNGLTWQVERGQHWAILGANGSGKTSLLAALTGYLTPSGGDITLLGETYGESDWRELRKKVGIVSSALRQKVPDWDPAELVVIGGHYAMVDFWGEPTRKDKAEAKSAMRRAECLHLTGREWGVLSQGERQRVLIARALIAKPEVLILDEPCAGLDPVARERFLKFLSRLAAKKNSPTLLFVTHHVEEIIPAFTHALLLRKGKIETEGPIAQTLSSASMSKIFGASLKLQKRGERYSLA